MFYLFAFLKLYMWSKLTSNPRFRCIILRVALRITTIDTEKECYALIFYNFNTYHISQFIIAFAGAHWLLDFSLAAPTPVFYLDCLGLCSLLTYNPISF